MGTGQSGHSGGDSNIGLSRDSNPSSQDMKPVSRHCIEYLFDAFVSVEVELVGSSQLSKEMVEE